jgi:hypothetical protein
MKTQFVNLYTAGSPKWETISELVSDFEWTDMLSQTTSEYLDAHGVSEKYSREMVEAATRVNYGQVRMVDIRNDLWEKLTTSGRTWTRYTCWKAPVLFQHLTLLASLVAIFKYSKNF